MKRVLLLDGESSFALSVVRAFSQLSDWQIEAISSRNLAPMRFSTNCVRTHLLSAIDSVDNATYLERLQCVIRKVKPDVLLPIDINGIHFASAFREELSEFCQVTPTPSADMLAIANDKSSFAEFTNQYEFPHPRTLNFSPRNLASQLVQFEEFRFPILVKPIRSAYGRGIRRFSRIEILRDYFRNQTASSEALIAQEEILGTDIDCSMLCKDGNIIASTVQRPLFENKREFSSPAAIEMVQDEKVISIASKLARSLSWSGVAHIDMRYERESGKVYLIEMNPRFWGSLAASTRAGVNFPILCCQLTLGIPLSSTTQRHIRYASGQTLAKVLSRSRPKGQSPLRFSETVFIDSVVDPLPAIVEFLNPDWRSVNPKRSLRNAFGLSNLALEFLRGRTDKY
jgi:predicted ATP-grasp superfamily ATP-dependent carboligase